MPDSRPSLLWLAHPPRIASSAQLVSSPQKVFFMLSSNMAVEPALTIGCLASVLVPLQPVAAAGRARSKARGEAGGGG